MRMRLAVGLAGVAAVLLAGVSGRFYTTQGKAAQAEPDAEAVPTVTASQFRSDLPQLAIIPAKGIVANDFDQQGRRLCLDPVAVSPEAKALAARGYYITGELDAAPYRLVSFAAGGKWFWQDGGPRCWTVDGRIALFRDGRMEALIGAANPLPLAAVPGSDASPQLPGHVIGPFSIGMITRLESGVLRLIDGHPIGRPLADMKIGQLEGAPDLQADNPVRNRAGDASEMASVRIVPSAPFETLCGGKVRVPAIRGLQLSEARSLLQQSGWRPWPAKEELASKEAVAQRERGLVETVDCTPSMGRCQFVYVSSGGVLHVITRPITLDPPGQGPPVHTVARPTPVQNALLLSVDGYAATCRN